MMSFYWVPLRFDSIARWLKCQDLLPDRFLYLSLFCRLWSSPVCCKKGTTVRVMKTNGTDGEKQKKNGRINGTRPGSRTQYCYVFRGWLYVWMSFTYYIDLALVHHLNREETREGDIERLAIASLGGTRDPTRHLWTPITVGRWMDCHHPSSGGQISYLSINLLLFLLDVAVT